MKTSVTRPWAAGAATLCGVAIATSALLLPVSAGAAPAPSTTPVVATANTPASVEHATLDEALAAAGITRAEFDAQAELVDRLVQAEQEISEQHPGTVAGVQVVDGRGQVVVGTNCTDAEAACADAAARGLEAVDPATAAADRAAATGPAAGHARPRAPFHPAQSLGSSDSGQPAVSPTPAPSPSPTPMPTSPAPRVTPLMGGAEYINPTTGVACSLGVNAIRGGTPVNITAAHCSERGNPVQFVEGPVIDPATNQTFGDFVSTAMDIPLDYAVISGNATAGARLANNLVTGPTSTPLTITGWQKPVVGQIACKSGWRSGYTCGPVIGSAGTLGVAVDAAFDKTVYGLCALHGDSGSPIFSGTKALGIVSVSNSAPWNSCADAVTGLQDIGDTPKIAGPDIATILAKQPGLAVQTG